MNKTPSVNVRSKQQQRVMIVDDDAALRLHARNVLRSFGCAVCEAESGEQAIELLGRERIDVVLLDVVMPGMDGFETTRRMRQMQSGEFLPIIVVTGLDDMQAVDQAYHAGATDFATKPIDWRLLKQRVRYTANARCMAEQMVTNKTHRKGQGTTTPDAERSTGAACRIAEADLPKSGGAERELRQLAYYDRVTGLPNQEMLQQVVSEKIERRNDNRISLSLVRVELQGLDYTRSLLGNARADQLLCQCAERIRGGAGTATPTAVPGKELVGRVGDAGFAVVRDDVQEKAELQDFADQLHHRMTRKYVLGDYEIDITARLGIAMLYKGDKADAATLFERADMAVARSESGPAFYSPRFNECRMRRAQTVRELQSAAANGELHLEYQPKVDSLDHRLLGVEALVRWRHPERGLVSPTEFIPLAEEHGIILPIGEFVLDEACRQSRQWREAGRESVPIAVNFSGHQFNKRGLVRSVVDTLESHGLGHAQIEIELTETVAMEQCDETSSILDEFHDLGIRTAIDDFGAGYSSLSMLQHLQFHTLKIDRSFIADMASNNSAASIVRGIIGMGHALGMLVVAEGVEQAYQLDYLRAQRCDLIQGYLTGRPASAQSIQNMLPVVA